MPRSGVASTLVLAALVAATVAGAATRGIPTVDRCHFDGGAKAAFCDTFDEPFQGGRSGDLDSTKWSVVRLGASNLGQGMFDEVYPATVQYCPTLRTGVFPDHDSFVCGREFGEPNHWMTAINDNGGAPLIAGRILQPFDFANRTGTIEFDVDAKTAGSHSWWPEVWIADRPQPAPHDTIPLTGPPLLPRNGIGFVFAGARCPTGAIAGKSPGDPTAGWGAVSQIVVVRGYRDRALRFQPAEQPCYRVQSDHSNHFELRIARNRVEVWASDFTPDLNVTFPNFRRVLVATDVRLPFTRGYVSFEQAHYNGEKAGVSSMQTYHWHGIGFDGPVLPPERDYQVPDALAKRFVWPSKTRFDGLNLGYRIDARPLRFAGVDLTGAHAAWLSLTFAREDSRPRLRVRYRVNGHAWRTYVDPRGHTGFANSGVLIPLQLAELRSGANAIQISPNGSSRGSVANLDLLVDA
jgi:hypothetical protein